MTDKCGDACWALLPSNPYPFSSYPLIPSQGPRDKASVVSAAKTSVVLAAKKAATSAATSDISMKSKTPRGRRRCPRGAVDEIEMSDVAVDVAAFLAAVTTDVLAVHTTDVLSAAKAADGSSRPAIKPLFNSKANA